MAVFRIEKTRDYTVMANHHLRNKALSLKAKGLLSLMLSLPEDWDYTTRGLSCICKDGVDSIRVGIQELEANGYLVRERRRNENGQYGAIEYTILEKPRQVAIPPPVQEKPILENPTQVIPMQVLPTQEIPAQLSIEESNTQKSNTDESNTHLDKTKIEEQKKAVRAGYDMDILPSDLATYGEEAKKLLSDLQSRNQRMFLITFLILNPADTKRQLDNNFFQTNSIAQKYNCQLVQLDFQQEEGMVSSLPLGLNQIEIQRGLTSSGVAIFVPFTTQELFQNSPEALYCGINALSNNIIMVDRKWLKNPNGLILGTPGSGKSFAAKREIVNVFLATNDDIMICDPEGEYYPLVHRLDGQVIKISPTSHHHINPMDINLNYSDEDNPLSLKSDFILSLCELIVGGKEGLKPVEKTVIDRCVRMIYQKYLSDPRPENMPILGDLYNCLRKQEEKEAQFVATALEIYVDGSLNVFNHRTDVDVSNRVVCYDIKELGKQLKKIGMLIVQDQVWNRVTRNREARKATRYYIDEFHLLLKEEQTAAYSVEIWKRFRKMQGCPTGITQNVVDLLASKEVETIFANSDYICMLNQAAGDRKILAQHLGISPHQLSYVTHAYRENRELLRFHYHRPQALLTRLEELSLPRKEYHSDMATLPETQKFITEDEIADSLANGSSFEGGKSRIYAFFQTQHSPKEYADFLKEEYGTGGRSHAVSRESGSFEEHGSKGIILKKSGCADVQMNWNKVASRISELIRLNLYFTPDEQALYDKTLAQDTVRNTAYNSYNAVKEAHPDDMVLYQVGDFFEMYGEDARQAELLLDLNLTSRNIPDVGRVTMCGIPVHSLEQYVEKLRDKYDVTIVATQEDSNERRIYMLPSIDHEAENAINAYEAEFGADGTRVFRDPAAEQPPQPTVRELFDRYKLTVGNALSRDTAFVNACRNSDRQNAYLEGADAIRRTWMNLPEAGV